MQCEVSHPRVPKNPWLPRKKSIDFRGSRSTAPHTPRGLARIGKDKVNLGNRHVLIGRIERHVGWFQIQLVDQATTTHAQVVTQQVTVPRGVRLAERREPPVKIEHFFAPQPDGLRHAPPQRRRDLECSIRRTPFATPHGFFGHSTIEDGTRFQAKSDLNFLGCRFWVTNQRSLSKMAENFWCEPRQRRWFSAAWKIEEFSRPRHEPDLVFQRLLRGH